jgi:hypothetical protein
LLAFGLPNTLAAIDATRLLVTSLLLRPGRCVKADPAALFASLLALGLLRTLPAALAAFSLVTSLFIFLAIYSNHVVEIKDNKF